MKTDNDNKMLLSFLEERAEKCRKTGQITFSRFLDLNQQSLCASMKLPAGVSRIFYGASPAPERAVAVFAPDELEINSSAELEKYYIASPRDCPVTVLKVVKDRFSKPLGHRDYLGALMALGINRDVTGDIETDDSGARIAVAAGMADYIAGHLTGAGRGTLKITAVYPWDYPSRVRNEGNDESFTVSSLRLDSVVKNGFRVSREEAHEAIEHGSIFVNDRECEKPDKRLTEGDKVTFRHRGRLIIEDCSGVSRKGKTIVKIKRFL
ncbi:MAG: hypothetical protein K6F64_06080 [Clostridia bacterium]|nr:hypothetical protein [Clostridia bacterium]